MKHPTDYVSVGFAVCQILQTGPYLKKDGRKTGVFLTKIRALDGRKDGRRRAKFKFLFLKKARKFDSRLFSWLHWLGRASKLKIMRRNHFLKVHSLVATWFNLLNSSLTLWTCTKSQKDGQNCKNTGVRRAILPKCPSRRANPSLDGRLWHTGFRDFFGTKFFRDRFWDFFWYQIFSRPVPRLFSVPNFFDSGSDTIK